MPWSDGLCQGQGYPSHREGGWIVIAVWFTLNSSADGTGLLERLGHPARSGTRKRLPGRSPAASRRRVPARLCPPPHSIRSSPKLRSMGSPSTRRCRKAIAARQLPCRSVTQGSGAAPEHPLKVRHGSSPAGTAKEEDAGSGPARSRLLRCWSSCAAATRSLRRHHLTRSGPTVNPATTASRPRRERPE